MLAVGIDRCRVAIILIHKFAVKPSRRADGLYILPQRCTVNATLVSWRRRKGRSWLLGAVLRFRLLK